MTKTLTTLLFLLLFLTGCTGRRERMQQVLQEAKAQNEAFEPLTGDSLLREAVDYFDRHGTANDRLRARYLLGCAYRDLHEAPLALITWEDAVACADTLSPDCDYATLFRVYGQMADIYGRQYMPQKGLEADLQFCKYALLSGDTLNYIRGLLLCNNIYDIQGDTSAIFQNIALVRTLYLQIGRSDKAAQVYPSAIAIALENKQYERAYSMMQIFENESGLFDPHGNIAKDYERYYHSKGRYFLGVSQLDSAEKQFRHLLCFPEMIIDGYRGLLSVYQYESEIDSISKYAFLYEDAVSKYLMDTQTDAIAQAEGMYNYRRQQQKAQLQAQRAHQRGIALLWLLVIICMILLLGALYYRKEKKTRAEKERMLDALTEDYERALNTLYKTRSERELLQQSLAKKGVLEILLKDKAKQIVQLEQLIVDLQKQISRSPDVKLYQDIEETHIMKLFHEISRSHFNQKKGVRKKTDSRPSTPQEWDELEEMIRVCHPQFYLFVKGHKLSSLKYKVCILSRYGFDNAQIATLTGAHIGSIPNARTALAKELFGLESASDLDRHLREI